MTPWDSYLAGNPQWAREYWAVVRDPLWDFLNWCLAPFDTTIIQLKWHPPELKPNPDPPPALKWVQPHSYVKAEVWRTPYERGLVELPLLQLLEGISRTDDVEAAREQHAGIRAFCQEVRQLIPFTPDAYAVRAAAWDHLSPDAREETFSYGAYRSPIPR